MELAPAEHELLVAGLFTLGESTKRGAGWGARFAARRMRADIFETAVELPLPLPAASALIGRTLDSLGGRTAESQVIMGSGALNTNPAVVTVAIREQQGGVVATVRGVAMEGLIPQRAGRKAARRVAQHLAAGFDG
ncbi:hypothetical protein [Paractinoplanes lichenicola]|uniref:CinA C-terminal domain-containing protein n=1 Tax=Paractinoplanes lichenicola TaxID=2802976 RepID=A0ABS1VMQ7_9ACTN|nr:hypothetical protein [Actinoplanes lichenicola]MBL7255935.1 hypothetical protein [Actinoplanes lichenicola]